jgi:hypothetical protein
MSWGNFLLRGRPREWKSLKAYREVVEVGKGLSNFEVRDQKCFGLWLEHMPSRDNFLLHKRRREWKSLKAYREVVEVVKGLNNFEVRDQKCFGLRLGELEVEGVQRTPHWLHD